MLIRFECSCSIYQVTVFLSKFYLLIFIFVTKWQETYSSQNVLNSISNIERVNTFVDLTHVKYINEKHMVKCVQ